MIQNGINNILQQHQLIPVATINSEKDIHHIEKCLTEKNIKIIEITLRTDFAWEAINYFKNLKNNSFHIGAGTVIKKEQIEKLKSLNIDFIVSPGSTKKLIQELVESGIPFLTGVCTVSEIMQAMENNCRYLKFFPANLFGGSKALSVYEQLFPDLKFCPTGGINEHNMHEYTQLKNVLSVGGSWMIK
jgi:2-dehydro-3-deoxyphosphogluconate aldolase/(4S)-4-hydroxy-2-oxoglutarate aldolase